MKDYLARLNPEQLEAVQTTEGTIRVLDRLYLSDSEGIFNDGAFKLPSRFIFDAGKQNLQFVKEVNPYLEAHYKKVSSMFSELTFQVGERVEYPVFGRGVITNECDKSNEKHNHHFERYIVIYE